MNDINGICGDWICHLASANRKYMLHANNSDDQI